MDFWTAEGTTIHCEIVSIREPSLPSDVEPAAIFTDPVCLALGQWRTAASMDRQQN